MSLDTEHRLSLENLEEFPGFNILWDNFNHLVAIRKSESPYQYDIYHNKENHPKYVGRVKVNQNRTISKSSKDLILNTDLEDSDKKVFELFISILNMNNSANMRFVWIRYSNSGEYSHFYIDERK